MSKQLAVFMSYVQFNDQHDDGQLTLPLLSSQPQLGLWPSRPRHGGKLKLSTQVQAQDSSGTLLGLVKVRYRVYL